MWVLSEYGAVSPGQRVLNTYGGLYIWADQEAYGRYITGEIFNAIKADEHLKNVESRDFGVFEDLSSLTMPRLRAVMEATAGGE
jgi:hypothetical protein